jgi:hypothetical protein
MLWSSNGQPSWSKIWHLCTVFIPRRSITGNWFRVWSGADIMAVAGSIKNSLNLKVQTVNNPTPRIQEILLHRGAERRSKGRTLINRNALLFFAGQTGVFPCCVHDVTNSGAGVRLEAPNVLPVEFDLSFDGFRTVRECRLVWRDADFVGVAFAT